LFEQFISRVFVDHITSAGHVFSKMRKIFQQNLTMNHSFVVRFSII
jgi:hypothetical protein